MLERGDMADRLAAEALLDGIDGDDGGDGSDLLPALCHRHHVDDCRRSVLRRAELLMARRREVPHA